MTEHIHIYMTEHIHKKILVVCSDRDGLDFNRPENQQMIIDLVGLKIDYDFLNKSDSDGNMMFPLYIDTSKRYQRNKKNRYTIRRKYSKRFTNKTN